MTDEEGAGSKGTDTVVEGQIAEGQVAKGHIAGYR